ncbi:MAG: hypothetical protein ABFS05_13880, partial [Bacteroidota bacterium]
MKSLVIYISLIALNLVSFSQPGFEWAQTCGKPFYSETNTRLAADDNANVIMAGGFVDTAYFGNEMIISNGGTDFFIAKHDPSGNVLWLTGDGGTNYERVQSVATGEQGIFVCGTFYGTAEIGTEVFPSLGSQDIFLAKYDHDGNFSWARHIGNHKTDYANSSCVDMDGNMIVTGYFHDSISIEGHLLHSMGASDIYILKYDPTGTLIWLEHLGGSSSDQSYSISSDQYGNIVVTGSYFYDITIGDTTLTTTDPTGVFYTVFNGDGDFQYATQVDGNGLIAQSFAAFDNNADIFFVGNFTDQVHFGPYSFDAGAFNIDVFITKYSSEGQLLWADHGEGQGSDQLVSIASGPLNDLYISGHYLHDIRFGNIMLEYTLCCGSAEIFIIRYTEDGTAVWGDQITGVSAMSEAMAKNGNDELFVAGMFQNELAFGDIILEAEGDFKNFLTGVATGTMT